MDFEEQPTRTDIAIRWLSRLSFVVFLLMAGGAIGFNQGATFVINETEARFHCEPK